MAFSLFLIDENMIGSFFSFLLILFQMFNLYLLYYSFLENWLQLIYELLPFVDLYMLLLHTVKISIYRVFRSVQFHTYLVGTKIYFS